ncbi:MAG: hypothetical protein Q4E22_04675 [Coriobacteriia bacterium]|nr:hypothetical protein [Coriobacteriia bacterium]
MKKLALVIASAGLALSLGACGSSEQAQAPAQSEQPVVTENAPAEQPQEAPEANKDDKETLPGISEAEEVGASTLEIDTSSGSSADGNIPVMFYDPDTILTQIGYSITGFSGQVLGEIYVDDVLIDKMQFGQDVQGTLSLSPEQLTKGIHTVTFIERDEDNKAFNIQHAQYEVK